MDTELSCPTTYVRGGETTVSTKKPGTVFGYIPNLEGVGGIKEPLVSK